MYAKLVYIFIKAYDVTTVTKRLQKAKFALRAKITARISLIFGRGGGGYGGGVTFLKSGNSKHFFVFFHFFPK